MVYEEMSWIVLIYKLLMETKQRYFSEYKKIIYEVTFLLFINNYLGIYFSPEETHGFRELARWALLHDRFSPQYLLL